MLSLETLGRQPYSTNNMTATPKTINIHGKEYIEVSERLRIVHAEKAGDISIITEIITHDPVLIKASVKIGDTIFTGHSAADPKKTIEAQNPYEVAETSAVGRALGFAGYGLVQGVATADEINKGGYAKTEQVANTDLGACPKCGSPLVDQTTKAGKKMTKCSTNRWNSALGQAEGCDYVVWGSPNPQVEEEDYPFPEEES